MIGDRYKYYQTLELPRTATKEHIKLQFKNLAKKWHPDRNQDNENNCKEMFINIYTAYQVLSDDIARAEYDRFLNALDNSQIIDDLLEQEVLFNEWLKKGKKDAEKKYREYKMHGEDFVDVIINFSAGIIKATGVGIKKIVNAGKHAIDKTFTREQKEAIKNISRTTARGMKFFFRSIFNVILWSGAGLAIGWVIGKNLMDENSGDLMVNIIWLGTTLIALIYNFVFRKPEEMVE